MRSYKSRPAYPGWLERKRVRISGTRAKWKKEGKCVRCGGIRDSQYQSCSMCRKKNRARDKERRDQDRQVNICVTCHKNPITPGYASCDTCREKLNHTKRNEGTKRWRRQIHLEVLRAYGEHCVCCGETEPLFLEIDHVNGGGSQHRKSIRGGSGFYSWLKNQGYPQDDFQILCRNCNYGKHRNKGICPHQQK